MSETRVDVDAVMAEVRERVRQKRARGIYSDEVEAFLATPLPGGAALFADELARPLAALPAYLGTEVAYDPRSRRPVLGDLLTLARKALMWVLRWWIQAVVERQDRVNRLVLRALQDLEQRTPPALDTRIARLETEIRRRQEAEVAANLDWEYFGANFWGDEPLIRELTRQFVPFFESRQRVLDLGCGRGEFLALLEEAGIGAYGVDAEARMVRLCTERGLEAYQIDAAAHLRELPSASIDGVFASHFAEHVLPGELIDVLRACRRVLKPGSPIVMVSPNVRTISVGAHSFWFDPSHRRPLPPELLEFLFKVEGFVDVSVRTYSPTDAPRLSEDVDDAMRANVRLLNERLFGDRDFAVVGRQPASA